MRKSNTEYRNLLAMQNNILQSALITINLIQRNGHLNKVFFVFKVQKETDKIKPCHTCLVMAGGVAGLVL